ncbi:HEAT repeat domain-containing protein, partial [Methanotrichaceae archaeon M04Ac]
SIEKLFVCRDHLLFRMETKMRLKPVLALLMLAALSSPIMATDEIYERIWDLKYGPPDARLSAVVSIGESGDDRAVDLLIDALRDEDQRVRKAAAEALGEIGDDRAVDPLIECLRNHWVARTKAVEGDIWVALAAGEALGKIGDPRAVDPLIEVLDWHNTYAYQSLQNGIVRSLGMIGDDRAVDSLIKMLDRGWWESRASAAWALGEIGDPRAVEPLIKALPQQVKHRQADWQSDEVRHELNFRSAAARALGKIGDDRAVDPLIRSLQDEDGIIRLSAVEALGEIGDDKAIGPLAYVVARDSDPEVRSAAEKALAKIQVGR